MQQGVLDRIRCAYRRRLRGLRARSRGIYSSLDEQVVIERVVKELGIRATSCVDIAAGDGVTMSNTYALFRRGWEGVAVEYDPARFRSLAHAYRILPKANLARCKVTPDNVVALLRANGVPTDFGVLSLDLDGYDYFVLERILAEFRPSLICVEINEKIPPPVKFTINFHPTYSWKGDHFYGQSISQLCLLCPRFRYSLIQLHYNNAFLVPSEINTYAALTPEDAYRKGYVDQPERRILFSWNADMEHLLTMSPEGVVEFLNHTFQDRKGEFSCSL